MHSADCLHRWWQRPQYRCGSAPERVCTPRDPASFSGPKPWTRSRNGISTMRSCTWDSEMHSTLAVHSTAWELGRSTVTGHGSAKACLPWLTVLELLTSLTKFLIPWKSSKCFEGVLRSLEKNTANISAVFSRVISLSCYELPAEQVAKTIGCRQNGNVFSPPGKLIGKFGPCLS